ncbi:MAPEG family protein [Rhizobium sp. 'Codium 1']|uniref:MAPEG family protein n=1 Tax=Rhizobium sp. 'Codium 1' TaxID=2940484 RepID=UPI001E33E934|nr:MAPEG family protein [Rhizobium sp. 'Codium 1']MCC8931260.1 MAPEG family protein [Rhizobium sp. 'Codium 1']
MTGFEMFWPLLAHAFLVFGLYALLVVRRAAVVRAGKVERIAFRENLAEPEESRVVNRAIANQFELPVLFYAVSVLLFMTEADNLAAVALAWIFVLARYVQAAMQVIGNLPLRRLSFMLGFVALFLMWLWLAIWMATS